MAKFKYKGSDYDYDEVIRNIRNKVANSVDSSWTDDLKAEYRRSYDRLIDALEKDAKGDGTRFSVNDWGELVDNKGEFTNDDHDNDDKTENYYNIQGKKISLKDYEALKEKKRKDYSTFNANRRFVNLLHSSIGGMSLYKTPEATKYNAKGFMTWLTNKINPSGEAIDYNNWIVLDPYDEKTKKRGFTNRLNQHALWLEDYMKTVKPETNFEGTAFSDYNDWDTRGKRLIANLRNGVLDESDKRDMAAFGMKWSDWKDFYYDGEKIVPLETPTPTPASETPTSETVSETTTGRTFSDPRTLKLYNQYSTLFDNGLKIEYEDGLLDSDGNYNSNVWNNVMALEFLKRNFRDSDGLTIFNNVSRMFWEHPFRNASRYLPTYYNIIQRYGDALYAPIAYSKKSGYYILPNPRYTTQYGAQIIYNPTTHHMLLIPVEEEGGKIPYAKDGTKTRGSYNDWSSDQIRKMGESKGFGGRSNAGHSKGNELVGKDWTAAEWATLGTVAMDLGSIGASFIPGYGTAASAALGVTSSLTNFGIDIARDGLDWGDAKNLGINLGMDALGILPFGMGGTGKAVKIGKTIAKVAPKLMLAFGAYTTLPHAQLALLKGMTQGWDKMTSDDWANIGRGINVILSGGAGAARKYNNTKAAREAAGNAIEVTVKNAKGKKEKVILADSAAEHVLKATDKKKAIEQVLKSNEKFKDYTVPTKTEGSWHFTLNPTKMRTKSEVPIINDKVYATDKGNWSLMRPGAVSSNPFKRDFYNTEIGDYDNLRYFSARGGFWGGKNKVLGWKERSHINEAPAALPLVQTPKYNTLNEAANNLISYKPVENVNPNNFLHFVAEHNAGLPHTAEFNAKVDAFMDRVGPNISESSRDLLRWEVQKLLMKLGLYKQGGKVYKALAGINTSNIQRLTESLLGAKLDILNLPVMPTTYSTTTTLSTPPPSPTEFMDTDEWYRRRWNAQTLPDYKIDYSHAKATDALENNRERSEHDGPQKTYGLGTATLLNRDYTSNPNLVGLDLNSSFTYYNKSGNLDIGAFIASYNKDMQEMRDFLNGTHSYNDKKDPKVGDYNKKFKTLFASRAIDGNPGAIGYLDDISDWYGTSTWNRRVDQYEKRWDSLTDAEKKNRAYKINLGNNNFGYVYKMWNGDIAALDEKEYNRLNTPLNNGNLNGNLNGGSSVITPEGTKKTEDTPIVASKDWNPWEYLRYQANNASNRYMTDLYKAAEVPFLQKHSDLHSYVYDDLQGEQRAAKQGALQRALVQNNPTSDWLLYAAGMIDTNSLSLAVQEAAMQASSLLGRLTLLQAWLVQSQNLLLRDNDANVNKQSILLSYINRKKLEAILASKNGENLSQLWSKYSLDRLKVIAAKLLATKQYNMQTIQNDGELNYTNDKYKLTPEEQAAMADYKANGLKNMRNDDGTPNDKYHLYEQALWKVLNKVREFQYKYLQGIDFAKRGKKLCKDGSKVKIASMRSKLKSDSEFLKYAHKNADRNEKVIARAEKSMYRMREYKRSNK